MIVNEPGVILSRRNLGEADRLCAIYTENLGKVTARFVGVNKPRRKMKALSEPFMWAEFRLYTSPRSDIAKVIGGAIVSSFPDSRTDLDAFVASLSCLERLDVLTPARAPNADKYRLICSALAAIEARVSPWVPAAYSLQLLEIVGHSLRERPLPGEDRALWRRLHDTALDALQTMPWRGDAAERFMRACDDEIESLIGRALKSRDYAKRLSAPLEPLRAHA